MIYPYPDMLCDVNKTYPVKHFLLKIRFLPLVFRPASKTSTFPSAPWSFETRQESYFWLLDALELYRPKLYEFARLNISPTVSASSVPIQHRLNLLAFCQLRRPLFHVCVANLSIFVLHFACVCGSRETPTI